jgi:hypothetical protein
MLTQTQALWKHDAEPLKEHRLRHIGLRHTTQSDLAVRGRGQDHIVGVDAREFFEHGARGVAKAALLLPQLERFPQHEGEQAHKDVCFDAIGALMPDWTDAQLVFLDAECGLGL